MKKNNKDFDCVAFKREAQSTIYNEIKDFSPVEEVKYFKQKVAFGPFGEWWRSIKDKSNKIESMIVAEKVEDYGKE